ncbi:hypothetical protein A5844_001474 [Enterococcus sp. 10A9_DIV0425]|uniref:GyrI-like small molecule binding domain-containing protein n=1 Tax=Candidatus Enterococcus wittei TaxID=1987383 RepID=A0A242K0Z8_9ENTE|nr:GyrI-like domain-containing protein [Enterococcus sp. 10A9_DIV0425]OTP11339.1 hypothetical protein A5844_001474 [Enterococcus sp. 10A9_DIV0425]THE13707.1 hypothetical protein E1H99_05620 [Enterococcus hirae]
MEKIDWKKSEPGFSLKKQPQILELPAQNYFCIDGVGDPNKEDFQRRVACLYAISYTIRMSPKKQWLIPDYVPYTVYPLEGLWSLQKKYLTEKVMLKEHFAYRLMIKQPAFVTKEIADEALRRVGKKLPEDLADQIRFKCIDEGLVAQVVHIGAYDDEPETFEKLELFLKEKGYHRLSKEHKEIYMSDPRRSKPENLKTILRVKIARD